MDQTQNGSTASGEKTATIERLAARLENWGLSAPGIAFLEANKPFTFLSSQFLLFVQPLLSTFVRPGVLDEYINLLQDRTSVERLIQKLESNGEARPR